MSRIDYLARGRAAKVELKAKMEGLPSYDKPGNEAASGRLTMELRQDDEEPDRDR